MHHSLIMVSFTIGLLLVCRISFLILAITFLPFILIKLADLKVKLSFDNMVMAFMITESEAPIVLVISWLSTCKVCHLVQVLLNFWMILIDLLSLHFLFLYFFNISKIF